jgi:hypothetical protein
VLLGHAQVRPDRVDGLQPLAAAAQVAQGQPGRDAPGRGREPVLERIDGLALLDLQAGVGRVLLRVVEEPRGEAVDPHLDRPQAVGEDVQRCAVERRALGVRGGRDSKQREGRQRDPHSNPDAASRPQTTAMVL